MFQSSSLQVAFQSFQHEKQATVWVWLVKDSNAATEWLPCAVCLSCMFNLPLDAVLRGKSSPQGHRTVGQARKGKWTCDLRALRYFSFLVWKQSGPRKRTLKWEQWHQENLKIQENWWLLWTIPDFFCWFLETVGCEMHLQYVQSPAWLGCCCHGFLLLDASALAKYHCNMESLAPLLKNPGKLRWLYYCMKQRWLAALKVPLRCAPWSHSSQAPLVLVSLNGFKLITTLLKVMGAPLPTEANVSPEDVPCHHSLQAGTWNIPQIHLNFTPFCHRQSGYYCAVVYPCVEELEWPYFPLFLH